MTATPSGYALDVRKRGRNTSVWFSTEASIEAREVDAVLVEFRSQRPLLVQLSWAVEGQACKLGRVRSQTEKGAVAGVAIARLSTVGEPAWHGRIARVCLTVLQNEAVAELQRVALVKDIFDTKDVRPEDSLLRARLGSETRPALVGVNDRTVEWPVDVAPGSSLEFGFGVSARGIGTVNVRVASNRGEQTVFSESVALDGGLRPDHWHAAKLDLTPWAGESITLRFEVVSPRANRGLVLISEPRIVGPSKATHRPNLVVVSLDTLRPDHMSLYGYARRTSPQIDRWAERGIVFENAVTTSPWTLPAHLSLFSGLNAVRHGLNHPAPVPAGIDLLATELRSLGYQTLAITGGGYMHPKMGLDRGFDRYRYWPNRKQSDDEIRSTVAQALRWTEEFSDRPFFLFVHTYEVHHPYRYREPYFSEFFGSEAPPNITVSYLSNGSEVRSGTRVRKWPAIKSPPAPPAPLDRDLLPMLVAAYDSGIANADHKIAPLLDRLADSSLGARTATVVTSDHGEALGEKGYASHLYLEEFNARIPLILRPPGGVSRQRRVERQVSIVDVYPTLLALSGTPLTEVDAIDGRPLLSDQGARDSTTSTPSWTYASFSRRGLGMRLDNRWKYQLNNSASTELLGSEALFDLDADPEEQHNLAPSHPRAREFRRMAMSHLAANAKALSIRMYNPTRGSIVFELAGRDVNMSRTKGEAFRDQQLEWLKVHELRVSLPEAGQAEILLEGAKGHALTIRVNGEGLESRLFELSPLESEFQAQLANGTLIYSDAKGEPLLEIAWPGLRPESGAQVEESTEVREQLEALGYLD